MLFLYLLSGFSGLLYEIVWARLLALHIGHTAGAVSTVLAAFMAGLAAGAFVAGGYAGRLTRRNALRAYAVVELLVALCALALPLAVTASLPLLSGMYGDAPSAAFGAARVILCLALITVPAALMGATYPLAVRAAGSATAAPGGRMYSANTAGAALGAIATGFLLLPWLGNFRTTVVGAVLNATAAGGAWWLSMSQSDKATPARQIRRDRVRRETAIVERPRLAMAAVFVSGAVALLCEVAWTRVFAMILGPTTYAFATMLAAFIGGIAVGAVAGVRLGHRPGAVGALGWSLLVAGAGTAAGLAAISQVPLLVGEWTAPTSAQFLPVLLREAAIAGAVLLPATAGFGAAFTLALAVGARTEHAATDASRIYAANTTGAIAGSLAGGFVLIPAVGLRGTLVIAAAAALAAGVAVLLSDRRAAVRLKPDTTGGRAAVRLKPDTTGAAAVRLKPDTTGAAAVRLKPDTTGGARRRPYVGIATAAGVGAWLALSPGWNTALLSSGVYKYAPYLGTMDLREVLEAGEVLYYREGAAGAVSVRRAGAVLSLSIDGKVDASNGGDMLTQKLLAHLPLLLHSSPKRVAVVGLGSGVTAGAALVHPVDHLDVIEISPEVVEASRLFDSFSGQPLKDPRTRLLVGDARTHLSLGRRAGAYDVIISEPSNPWMAGVASLFTREFFEMAAARIAPGGVMCQWTHTYDIDAADLKKIVATFQSVFSDTSLWLVGDADLLLIGRVAPAADTVPAIERGFQRPGVAGDLRAVGARSPFAIISLFAGDSAAARTYASGAPVETDDRLGLEFSGPRSIVGRNEGGNTKELRALAASTSRPASLAAALAAASPADWRDRGTMLLTARSTAAFDDFSRAVAGGDEPALSGLREAALTFGRIDEAAAIMRRAADTHVRSPAALLELSRLLAAAGDPAAALRAAQDALARDTAGGESLRQIASVLADAGDRDGLNAFLEELRRADPAGADTRYYEAVSAFLNGSFQSAARDGEAALAIDPRHARARNLVGAARARLGDADGARRAFREAIAAAPDDPAPHVNLGALALEAGDTRGAITHFSDALAMDSHSPAAREGIAAALELEGDHARARRIRSKPLVPGIQQSR